MHSLNIAPQLVAAAAKAKTTNSSSPVFLVLIVVIALMYFFVMRPNQKRRMAAMRQARTFDIGDEVVAGGMVGHVVRMDDSMVEIQVSNGVIVKFVPQAVQLRSAYLAAQARTYGGRNAPRTSTGAASASTTRSGPSSGPVVDVDAPPPANGSFGTSFGAGGGTTAGSPFQNDPYAAQPAPDSSGLAPGGAAPSNGER